MRRMKVSVFVLVAFGLWLGACAEQCGRQAGGALCPNGPSPRLVTVPPAPPGQPDVTDIISPALFDEMLLHRNDPACPSHGFYTYKAFVAAARFFNGFLTTGDDTIRKRELAAFFGQTSHETTGGWPTAPNGPYTWGYCYISEIDNNHPYCVDPRWPCFPNQKYYGRGPIQLKYNYNYGQAGEALGLDLLSNPDLVATDAVVSFKTAIWFWMTSKENKPSSHDVIIGEWKPSNADIAAGRFPGYGVITNIINGRVECGHGPDERVKDRIEFYKRYCHILGIEYGNNLDCYTQKPFGLGLKLSYEM